VYPEKQQDHDEILRLAKLGQQVQNIRPEVLWFARQMETKLKENDHKLGWQGCEFIELAEHLITQSGDLILDLSVLIDDGDSLIMESIINKATNTAKFVMMIADNCLRIKSNE